MKLTKNRKKINSELDLLKEYSILEAVKSLKSQKFTKFDESIDVAVNLGVDPRHCLLYTSPSPRDATLSRMPSSA